MPVLCQGRYLKQFDLDRALLLADSLVKWSRNEMMLGAETLSNLNVLGHDAASLLSLCDKTVSSYGSRTLQHWLGHPLVAVDEIVARQVLVLFFWFFHCSLNLICKTQKDAVEATRNLFTAHAVLDSSHLKTKGKDEKSQFVTLLRLMASSGDLEQVASGK